MKKYNHTVSILEWIKKAETNRNGKVEISYMTEDLLILSRTLSIDINETKTGSVVDILQLDDETFENLVNEGYLSITGNGKDRFWVKLTKK